MKSLSIAEQNKHLEGVSRTFALTIPCLPEDLRDWVGNAYLLCRIADTIEDDPRMDIAAKKKYLSEFAGILSAPLHVDEWTRDICARVADSATAAENLLMKDITLVIGRYCLYPAEVQKIIRRGVVIMCKGMAQIERWNNIDSLDEVDHYCYSVAGVVGEILANLFAEHSPAIKKKLPELSPLAVSFGEALQLTNILKDVWDDARRGARWLPIANSDPEQRQEATKKYVAVALGHAMQALQFIKLLPRSERGIRKFCLLAAEMAVMTLRNIHENPLFREPKEIKISHSDVRNCVLMTFFCASSNLLLDLLFSHLSGKEMKPEFRDPAELMNKVSFWNSNNAYEYKPVQNDPSSK